MVVSNLSNRDLPSLSKANEDRRRRFLLLLTNTAYFCSNTSGLADCCCVFVGFNHYKRTKFVVFGAERMRLSSRTEGWKRSDNMYVATQVLPTDQLTTKKERTANGTAAGLRSVFSSRFSMDAKSSSLEDKQPTDKDTGWISI